MKKITNLLMQADGILDEISVRGNDVFRLSDARKLLKLAYDELTKPQSEVVEDG